MVYAYDPYGVFIQDVNGKLWTADAWDGSVDPNGIAVIAEECQFVIALEDAYDGYCKWGSEDIEVSGITTTTDVAIAKTDYDGEAQTTTILNVLGNNANDAPAAYRCRAYTFPDGSKGYLGAAGECQAALNNKSAITTAMSKCGGTEMSSYYWTSTQHSTTYGWGFDWAREGLPYGFKEANGIYARAFCAI